MNCQTNSLCRCDLEEGLFALVSFIILKSVCSFFDQALNDIRVRQETQHDVDMVLINRIFIQIESCFIQIVWVGQFVESYQDILLLYSLVVLFYFIFKEFFNIICPLNGTIELSDTILDFLVILVVIIILLPPCPVAVVRKVLNAILNNY